MTSHGFAGARAGSQIENKDLTEIARRISLVPGVIWAHAVDGPSYNIMFEFGHLHNFEKTTENLREAILKIEVNGKRVHKEIDFWTIQRSYRWGKPMEKEDPEHSEKE